jgi:ubiquinone/menaquinone biosynthesis C-methylase UbiE
MSAFFSYGQKTPLSKQTADSLSAEKVKLINAFLNLSPKDSIADIGTGSGYSLIPIANECPGCKFTIEDIDSISCNRKVLQKKIVTSGNHTSIDNFTFFYGTEKTTNLPSTAYNKILIFDVIHELTYKKEMLSEIKRILQKNGSIFIEEILVHKPVKKDKACNYPFLTEAEFKQLLLENNLIIKKEKITFDTGINKYIKIFECATTD